MEIMPKQFALTILQVIPAQDKIHVYKVVTGSWENVFGYTCGELIDFDFFEEGQTQEEADAVIEMLHAEFKDGQTLVIEDDSEKKTTGTIHYYFKISPCEPAAKKSKKRVSMGMFEPSLN